jgi:hypothetical protein
VQLAQLALKVPMVFKDPLVQPVQPVTLVQQAHKVQRASLVPEV